MNTTPELEGSLLGLNDIGLQGNTPEAAPFEETELKVLTLPVLGTDKDGQAIHCVGWPCLDKNSKPRTIPERYRGLNLSLFEALTRQFEDDRYLVCYNRIEPLKYRINKNFVDHTDKLPSVTMHLKGADIDAHKLSGEALKLWREETRSKALTLFSTHPGGFFYETRGGARLIYREAFTTIETKGHQEQWKQKYHQWLAYLLSFGLVGDPCTATWNNYFRLPWVKRDGVESDYPFTIGDPAKVALWVDGAFDEQACLAAARTQAEQHSAWGIVVKALMPPTREAPAKPAQNKKGKGHKAWFTKALNEEAEALAAMSPESGRNDALNTAVFKLATMEGADLPEIERVLTNAAYTCGLSDREIGRTIESALNAAASAPKRQRPDKVEAKLTALLENTEEASEDTSDEDPRTKQTDTGNAERLVKISNGLIRYVGKFEKWYTFTNGRWIEDQTGELQGLSKKAALTWREDADKYAANIKERIDKKELTDKEKITQAYEQITQLMAHAKSALSAPRRSAAIQLAASEPGISIRPDEFDTNHFLFNCANGTLNLKTGEFRPPTPEDLITKQSPVVYDPNAQCPKWLKFLSEIMKENQDMIKLLARLMGYCLTGETTEHIICFFFGGGRNGKSTFIETMLYILGDYGDAVPSDLLIAKKTDSHPTDKAFLFGLRMASAQEVKKGSSWDEQKAKALSGSDKIPCRRMREDYWTFDPTHKLIVSGNDKPRVQGTDTAIWERLKLIPFTVTILDADQDKGLKTKLRAEAPGILRWAVEGCLEWQRLEDLAFPKAVTDATREYRTSEDMIGRFIEDTCEIQKDAQETGEALYKAFIEWCDAENETRITRRFFDEQLEKHNFKRTKNNKGVWRHGLKLAPTPSAVDTAPFD